MLSVDFTPPARLFIRSPLNNNNYSNNNTPKIGSSSNIRDIKTTPKNGSDVNLGDISSGGQGPRKDRFGNLIKHEGGSQPKKYKVTFIDKILWVPISNVHEVESYKMYNA